MNVGRIGLALISGIGAIHGISKIADLNISSRQILELAGNTSLCLQYLGDTNYLKYPKQFGKDIKIFKKKLEDLFKSNRDKFVNRD